MLQELLLAFILILMHPCDTVFKVSHLKTRIPFTRKGDIDSRVNIRHEYLYLHVFHNRTGGNVALDDRR